ncbi:dihydrodipicolinate synthase family protein [Edaphobacter albus]|uniref:dihydrodipicolinate synthase family protein n=1 Tax=Edaphobacter sp. 4G125 TaxID=2763071 RepID=UPI00164827EA|nr:dihydrodipicolinate synthase family protein [Edaphobacter sp. 4G125]QNI35750.1 dihydrodipicolinate synthase family protein [Edaphobacter sp. 4G125]
MSTLRGVIVPVAVPVGKDYSVDPSGLERLVEFLIGNGAHQLFANGSMGAFAMLPDATQEEVVERVVSIANGRVPVHGGISDSGSTRVMEKIRTIGRQPVDSLILLPPYYYIYQQQELIRFFLNAADHAEKPIVLYDNPRLVSNSLSVESIVRLAEHPNIIGIKFSGTDVSRWMDLLRAPLPRQRFALISGAGKMTSLALQLGFDGITEGLHNIIPDVARQIYDTAARGDYKAADLIQQKINRCFRILEVDGGWRGLELSFQYMGIARQATIHPFDTPMEEKKRRRVLEMLEQEGILKPYVSLLTDAGTEDPCMRSIA